MGFPSVFYIPPTLHLLLQTLKNITLLTKTLLTHLGLTHPPLSQPTTIILPINPTSLKRMLPVVLYAALPIEKGGGDMCVVCLCGLQGRDEVRRLGNCCHAFHRGCIDRWIDMEQWTCPLCRAVLVFGVQDIDLPCC